MFHHELAYRPAFSHTPRSRRSGSNLAAVNVREKEDAYELHLMAPGRQKEDFKISVSADKMLLISYDAPEVTEQPWMHQEFKLQSFKRAVKLSNSIDATKISASYENGILVVLVPKAAEPAQTSVEIPVQ